MHFGDQNRNGWSDPDSDLLTRFPGPVAVIDGPVEGLLRSVTTQANDEEPWAVQVEYRSAHRYAVAIRTVRSRTNLNPRGLPVEDLPSAVLNYQLNQPSPSNPAIRTLDEAERRLAAQAQANRLSRQALGQLPEAATSVPIDGVAVPGVLIEAPNCTAVRLEWEGQTVFCAGEPSVVGTLRLRTAAATELMPPPLI